MREMTEAMMVGLFKVLADENRLKMIQLVETGIKKGREIREHFELEISPINNHLLNLTKAGILTRVKDPIRKDYEYSIAPEVVSKFIDLAGKAKELLEVLS
jgi:predicted transcriptional regulator